MQFSTLRPIALTSTVLLLFAAGCESPWPMAEPYADALIPPTNPWSCDMSREKLADTVGKPCDINFFGDQAEYMGDQDDYRYVHVRDMSGFWGFLGECVYKVPAKDWPMAHPMPFTSDASKWQDVTWMESDAPAGVSQNPFLHITPSFPLGAPKTQPAKVPSTTDSATQSAPDSSTSAPATPTTGATAPTTDAGASTTQSQPAQSAPSQPTTSTPTAPSQPPASTQETQPAVTTVPTTQPSLNK